VPAALPLSSTVLNMPTPDVDAIQLHLEVLHQHLLPLTAADDYYPARPVQDRFAIAYTTTGGEMVAVGDYDHLFPLHSISKVFIYGLALEDRGRTETLRRVGVEPSGEAYNAIRFDERNNRPFNPMTNTGALAACNLVHGRDRAEKVGRMLDRLRTYAANPDLRVDEDVLAYEIRHNDRNLGLSYLMRSMGMLEGDVEENLAFYLSICSVAVTARDLAMMGATLANAGANPVTGGRALARKYRRDVITVMATCGMYDVAGQWAYDVGLPAKSGVSGAIVAAMPGRFGLGLYSPGLDTSGHSVRGVAVCRELSSHYGLHMFAHPSEHQLGHS
jgi:glutaminase